MSICIHLFIVYLMQNIKISKNLLGILLLYEIYILYLFPEVLTIRKWWQIPTQFPKKKEITLLTRNCYYFLTANLT